MQQDFFIKNRQALARVFEDSFFVFAGNVSVQRSNDASYGFEQDAYFWYLSGIDAAGWRLIIDGDKSLLVAPDVDEIHRIFDGSLSNQEAIKISGVHQVLSFEEGQKYIDQKSKDTKSVVTIGEDPHVDHYDFSLNPGPVELRTYLDRQFDTVVDCRKELSKLRSIKQPDEIRAIRDAVDMTIDAFEKTKNSFDQYTAEYEIEADFTHSFRTAGATGHAYDPIVASGKNACTLHYGKNQDTLTDGTLVLIDVGVRRDGYAADITRTYAYGEVSDRHKAVHAAVEKAHQDIIKLLKPGLSVKEYSESVDVIMKQALKELGLLKAPEDYRRYFPHAVGHGLGIDVHDSMGGADTFQPGMVLTVEPGIYIPEESVGVRIEDDILITESGHENLSARLSTAL